MPNADAIGSGMRWIIGCALLALALPNLAKADQLPAPSSWQERRCALMFDAIKNVLYQNRDFFYDTRGVRDRDELAKQMTEFQSTRAMVNQFQQYCPDDARNFPAAAVL